MIAKPGIVKPAYTEPLHTRGWTFTIIIHGVEFEPVGVNKSSTVAAKALMRKVVKELNNE